MMTSGAKGSAPAASKPSRKAKGKEKATWKEETTYIKSVRKVTKTGEQIAFSTDDEEDEPEDAITSYEPPVAQRTHQRRHPVELIEQIESDDDVVEVASSQPKTFQDPFEQCYQALRRERAEVSPLGCLVSY